VSCPTLRIAVLILALAQPACYRNAVVVPRPDPVTEWRGQTVHSLFWGLIKSRDLTAQDCAPSNGLDIARNTSNFGFALITVVTLGIWSPTRLEWRCARLPSGGNGDMP
jgi:hypothetical protein